MNEHRLRQALLERGSSRRDRGAAPSVACRAHLVRRARAHAVADPPPASDRRRGDWRGAPRGRGEPTRTRGDRRGREAVGTEKVVGVPQAKPALFSLPAKGRVLVSAPSGAWIVSADGSRRKLGDYDEATWSPRGLFVGVSKRHQLAAVTPKGDVRWTLSRPRAHDAGWAPSGFRVAYLSGSNLRVVAGDGTGDRRVDAALAVAPAWRPGAEHVLAYADRNGVVTVLSTDDNQTLWTAGAGELGPAHFEWSADAARLLVGCRRVAGGRFALVVYDSGGRRLQSLEFPGQFVDAAFAPEGHRIAVVRRVGPRERAAGRRGRDAPSADGRVQRPGTIQRRRLVARRSLAAPRLGERRPVALHPLDRREQAQGRLDLAVQFDPGGSGTGQFPRIEGWCCPG